VAGPPGARADFDYVLRVLKISNLFFLVAIASAGCASRPAAPPSTAVAAADTGGPQGVDGASPTASDAPSKNLIHVEEEVVIDAPIERILPVFDDPQSYKVILPMVRSIHPRGNAPDGALLVELEQGISFVSGSYTARIFKVSPNELDLSVDHAFPSVLHDGKGHVVMKPEGEGKTRVTYKMTADIGESWALHLLKDRIRSALTRPPYLLKSHVEGKH